MEKLLRCSSKCCLTLSDTLPMILNPNSFQFCWNVFWSLDDIKFVSVSQHLAISIFFLVFNLWPFITFECTALSSVRGCLDNTFLKAAKKTANPTTNSNTSMYKPNLKISRIYKKEQIIYSFQRSNIGIDLSINRVS